jgi:amino acid permease-like protein
VVAVRGAAGEEISLIRGLRKWDLVALVINSVIGAGIFGLPSQVYALAGTYSLAAYGIAAVAVGLFVLCFAEVGSRFGGTGGPYLYTHVAFGPLIGFQVGWLMWIARVAGFASVVNLSVAYVAFFVPVVNAELWRAAVIIAVVVLLAGVNIAGLRTSAAVTNVLTAGKVIPLFLLAVGGFFFVDPQRYSFAAVPPYGAFSKATLLVMFAFAGFESALIPAGEMRNPQRHLPFSLFIGMSVVTALYISVQAVCIGTVPDLTRRPAAVRSGAPHGRSCRRVGGRRCGADLHRGGLERHHLFHAAASFCNGSKRRASACVLLDARTVSDAGCRNRRHGHGSSTARAVQHVCVCADDQHDRSARGLHGHVRGAPCHATPTGAASPFVFRTRRPAGLVWGHRAGRLAHFQ